MSALRTNVWFAGKLISENSNAVFPDRVGTNRASGARFHPYGDEITSTANDREKFATYTRDSYTGLDYADRRFYASAYGRFNTPDPDGGSAKPSKPGSWNRFAYVSGDPVNRADPTGLTSCDVNGDNCYDSIDVSGEDDDDVDLYYLYSGGTNPANTQGAAKAKTVNIRNFTTNRRWVSRIRYAGLTPRSLRMPNATDGYPGTTV